MLATWLFSAGKAKAQWQMQGNVSLYTGYYSSVSFVSDSVGFLLGCSEFSSWNSIILFKTTDGGRSWSIIKGASGGGCLIPHSFPDDQTGYCMVSFGTFQANELQKTTDGGLSWQQPDTTGNLQLGSSFSNDHIYFVNAQLGFISKNQYIYKTANGGKSWQIVNASHTIRSFFFTSPQTGYAGGDHSILKTSDGGAHWTPVDTSHSILSLFFPSPNIGYATGINGTILKTTDAGNSWTPQSTGLSGQVTLNSVFCPDNTTCYAVGEQGTILYTNNGGTSWTKQYSGVQSTLHSVSCTRAECFAVGDTSVLLKTTNIITGLTNNDNKSEEIRIFPNPFSDETTISLNHLPEKPVSISLCNLLGEELKRIDDCSGTVIGIKRENLRSGLYVLHLIRDSKTLLTTRLIITD